MVRHWKLFALGISMTLGVSAVQASTVAPNLHNDREYFWNDHGFRAVNGMLWQLHQDKPHHHKKHTVTVPDDTDDTGSGDPVQNDGGNSNPATNLDVTSDNNQTTGDTTTPPFVGDNDPKGTGDLFNDSQPGSSGENVVVVDDGPRGCTVPLPPAAWTGLATLIGAGWTMRRRFIGA